MTATWPISSAVAAADIDAGADRRLADAAWCFHSSSYTWPRRVRRSPVGCGSGSGARVEITDDGAMGIEQVPPVDDGGGGVGGVVLPVPPPHAATSSVMPIATIAKQSRCPPVRCIIAGIIRTAVIPLSD